MLFINYNINIMILVLVVLFLYRIVVISVKRQLLDLLNLFVMINLLILIYCRD